MILNRQAFIHRLHPQFISKLLLPLPGCEIQKTCLLWSIFLHSTTPLWWNPQMSGRTIPRLVEWVNGCLSNIRMCWTGTFLKQHVLLAFYVRYLKWAPEKALSMLCIAADKSIANHASITSDEFCQIRHCLTKISQSWILFLSLRRPLLREESWIN